MLQGLHPLIKAALLCSQIVANKIALTPPSEGPNLHEKEQFRAKGASEAVPYFLLYGGNVLKFLLYGLTSSEITLIIGFTFPRLLAHIPRTISAQLLELGSKLQLTLPFCTGYALVLAGTAIRAHCYRRLRDRFTFELAIRKGHKLETGGLYSIVRHPAYVGSLLFIGGTFLCIRDSGSLLASAGVWETWWGKAFHSFAAGMALLAGYVFVDRTQVEDEALRQFGEQWTQWARKTRYKLVPFVF